MFTKLKKELVRSNNRKLKKQNSRKFFIKQINLKEFKFSFFVYFLQKQKIFINRKILKNVLITENGSFFSLMNWIWFFHNKKY